MQSLQQQQHGAAWVRIEQHVTAWAEGGSGWCDCAAAVSGNRKLEAPLWTLSGNRMCMQAAAPGGNATAHCRHTQRCTESPCCVWQRQRQAGRSGRQAGAGKILGAQAGGSRGVQRGRQGRQGQAREVRERVKACACGGPGSACRLLASTAI